MKIPLKSCRSSLAALFPVTLTQTRDPNVLNPLKYGFLSHQASNGVIPIVLWTL